MDVDGEDGTTVGPFARVAGVTSVDGGFTVNWVPVTTVTWAPPTVGPKAVMTAPESDLATAWAAAWSTGFLWA